MIVQPHAGLLFKKVTGRMVSSNSFADLLIESHLKSAEVGHENSYILHTSCIVSCSPQMYTHAPFIMSKEMRPNFKMIDSEGFHAVQVILLECMPTTSWWSSS